MENKWSEREARQFTVRYARQGIAEDMALRVYSSQLLGQEHKLVIHGGGNTSVKTTCSFNGDQIEVLCVKGSGWDLGTIEPAGLPAVKLEPLRKLVKLESLSDEDMVNIQRTNLLDASAPNPSVETLLHAFLPYKFIDHTHSNAILTLCNQLDGEKVCQETFGDQLIYVPYIMPGFSLAKNCRILFDKSIANINPDPLGMLLLNHGLVTFGDSAIEAYTRMIDLVSQAEKKIDELRHKPILQKTYPSEIESIEKIAPVLRGILSSSGLQNRKKKRNLILEFRNSESIQEYVNGSNLHIYSQKGTVTPDHVIRIKPKPLILDCPVAGNLDDWQAGARKLTNEYIEKYKNYFLNNNANYGHKKEALDPAPVVILIPKVGLVATGVNLKNAKICADLAETNIEVIRDCEQIGSFECISEKDIFEIEHWSLEQAKLRGQKLGSMEGKIVAITGGAGEIGRATAIEFKKNGAEVALLDRDGDLAKEMCKKIGGLAIECDVTSSSSVEKAFRIICKKLGGVDVVVSNAGGAWEGEIGTVAQETLRESFALNFWGHQTISQKAVQIMRQQKLGGCLLFNTSKQALNPGRKFGPYGIPKAATLFLMKQYALDHGADGIRSNAVNADRIRSGLLTEEFIAKRALARGIKNREYMSNNLLKQEVESRDVAEAFVFLAKAEKTSAAIITVDGGNIEASVR